MVLRRRGTACRECQKTCKHSKFDEHCKNGMGRRQVLFRKTIHCAYYDLRGNKTGRCSFEIREGHEEGEKPHRVHESASNIPPKAINSINIIVVGRLDSHNCGYNTCKRKQYPAEYLSHSCSNTDCAISWHSFGSQRRNFQTIHKL